MKTTKKGSKMLLLGMLGMVLALSLSLAGCSSLIGLISGENRKTDEAAKTFIGKSVDELLAVGSPKYAQTAGKIEKYAFYNWDVRKAAGDEAAKAPAIYSEPLMVIFTCTDGVVQSHQLQVEQAAYFSSWVKM